jgi:hypothetical protein
MASSTEAAQRSISLTGSVSVKRNLLIFVVVVAQLVGIALLVYWAQTTHRHFPKCSDLKGWVPELCYEYGDGAKPAK